MAYAYKDQVFKAMTQEVLACAEQSGWYEPNRSYDTPLDTGTELALIHSEVSEMLEAYRVHGLEENTTPAGKPDDIGAEAADVLIRLVDFCGRRGIDLSREFDRKTAYNRTRSYRHGGKLL